MVENHLTRALRECIEDAVKEIRLPVKNGEPRAPKVFNGYLPPKGTRPDDDYPFVVVRFDTATIEIEETVAKVSIIAGCYTQEFDGHEHCMNVLRRICNAFEMLPNNILANKYVLKYPITMDVLETQPYPYWQGGLDTTWAYRTAEAPFDC